MNSFTEMWNEFVKQFITMRGYVNVLNGLWATLQIAVLGLLIGIVIGTLIAVVRVMPKYKLMPRILDKICVCYIELFRGTPMVVQLLIIHFVLFPMLGLDIPAVFEAILAFGLNSAAYVSEIIRGGILSVDIGQTEAGRALGLNYGKTMIKIVLPQAIKNVLPAIGNEFISLLKETSVIGYLGVIDLTKAAERTISRTMDVYFPYISIALVYLVIVCGLNYLVKKLERRLAKSDRG